MSILGNSPPLPTRARVGRCIVTAAAFCLLAAATNVNAQELPTIRRTEYGVPHILASDFRGIGIGLGYTQVEDYGERVILGLVRAKGWMVDAVVAYLQILGRLTDAAHKTTAAKE